MNRENGPGETLSRLLRGIGASAFDKVVILAIQLGLVPILTLKWGVHLYGTWLMLSTIPTYLALSDLGFATAAGNEMIMKVALHDRGGANSTFQSAWAVIIVASGVILLFGVSAVCAFSFEYFVSPDLSERDIKTLLILLLCYGVAGLQNSGILAGFRATGRFATGRLGTALMFSGEGVFALAVVSIGGGPVQFACALLAGRVSGVLLLALVLHQKNPWLRIGVGCAQLGEVKRLLRPAAAAVLLPFSEALFLQGTALAVGAGASPTAVALFTSVRTVARVGTQFTNLVSHPLMPEFSAAASRNDRHRMAAMTIFTFATSALIVGPMFIGFLLFGHIVVSAWTHQMIQPSQSLIFIMGLSLFINGFWYPISNLLLSMNKHGLYAKVYLAVSIACVALAFVLSRWLGATGGAIAMCGLDLIMAIYVLSLAQVQIASWRDLVAAAPIVGRELRVRWSSMMSNAR